MSLFASETHTWNPIADVMRQPRNDALGLTMYLLGFDPYSGSYGVSRGSPPGAAPSPGAFGVPGFTSTRPQRGYAPGQAPTPGGLAPYGGNPAYSGENPGFGNNPPNQPAYGTQRSRIESVFGPLVSPLQRQAMDAAGAYLASDPYQKAFEAMNAQLGVNPGQQVMDALQPRFQQNVAALHGQGNRFSSGNAIRESQALNDYNLLSAQALQQGVTQQQEAAKTLDMLSQGWQNTWNTAAALGDTETQRQLQILMAMLQAIQGATFGVNRNRYQTPSGLDKIGGFLGNAGGVAAGLGFSPFGGGGNA